MPISHARQRHLARKYPHPVLCRPTIRWLAAACERWLDEASLLPANTRFHIHKRGVTWYATPYVDTRTTENAIERAIGRIVAHHPST